jgi:hypothetical protein
MESNCPKCEKPLDGKPECKCGWKAEQPEGQTPSAEGGGLSETPLSAANINAQEQGAAPDNKQLGLPPAPERNLRPAPPPPQKAAAGSAAGSPQTSGDVRRPEPAEENKEEDRNKEEDKKDEQTPARGPENRPKAMSDQMFRQYVSSKGDKNIIGQNVSIHSRIFAGRKESAARSQEQRIKSDGSGNAVGQNVKQVNNYYGDSRPSETGPGGAAVESLIEITAALSSKVSDTPDFESSELGRYAAQLRAERILLLSCADEKVALGAAYALLDEAGVADECRRSLDFQVNAQKKCDQVPELISRRADGERPLTAVVVEAYSNGSKQFCDWLTRVDHLASLRIRGDLSENRFVLVCLVGTAYLERAENGLRAEGKRLNFPCWKIPFLRPLLKHHFPERYAELEERLMRQRVEGKWRSDETKFCQEVRDYIEADRLPEVIEAREHGDVPAPDVPPFRNGKAVEDALLYTAAYFPDLTLHEFDEVVGLLLVGKTTTVTVKSVRTNKEGEQESFDAEVQKPLAELWGESPDEYLEACRLEEVFQSDAATAVNFSSGKLRDDVRRMFETKHRMYALRQFQVVESRGLLFHTSPRVSAGMMRLCVEMALSHPDVVGRDWLYKTVAAIGDGGTPTLKLPQGLARPEAYAYERVAQLIRQMLEESRLEETAAGLLRQLMDTRKHEALLEIMRGLQFAPKINEFGWIKRVLDEGRDEARDAARRLLHGYIKKSDLYSLLRSLESWLPKPEQPPEAYAPSVLAALRLVAEFCWEARANFNPADYGAWPSRHPLFAFEDAAAAEDGLRRLFNWMLNPAMQSVLESVFEEAGLTDEDDFDYSPTTFVGELVVEWSFVLQGPGGAAVAGERAAHSARLDAAAVRDIMIEQVVKATDRAQRNEILLYWEEVRDFLGFVMDRRGYLEYPLDREEQKVVRWKRELVRGLIKRFRELSWQHRSAASPAGVVKVEQGVM